MGPNFFVIGTTKGGTSTIDAWLRMHPQVGTPKTKEMHFFCRCPNPRLRRSTDLDDYLGSFASGRAVGEASPCYIYYPEVPALLRAFDGVRLIVSLRDPVERYWSHYLMNDLYRPNGLGPEGTLEKNLREGRSNAIEDLFGMGLYGEQLTRYFEHFDRDEVLVLFLEETASDPGSAISRILQHLHLDHWDIDTSVKVKEYIHPKGLLGNWLVRNRHTRRLGNILLPEGARAVIKRKFLGDPNSKPQMPDSLRRRLRGLYATDSRLLESLLDRALPWDWHRKDVA